jgi:Zn-finger nucleic acid-binding protein
MDRVTNELVRVDRCQNCHGLYFDQLDQNLLDSLGTDTAIDTGDEELGAEYNDMVYVDCPKCDKMMDQKLTEDPVHIKFEFCPSCHSTFLDAGEFRQYVSADYFETFKSLLPGE